MVLGDCYLQKTGEKNARIRLKHSEKQKEYLLWKGLQFPAFFQGKPKKIVRFNPVFKKTYTYFRWQSNASPEIGRYRQIFYQNGKKVIPKGLPMLFDNSLSLAIWFMDDGYYYLRDKMAYIYIPRLCNEEREILLETLKTNFSLKASIKIKKKGNLVLVFTVEETGKLMDKIRSFIIPSMKYKISPDPLSTAA